MTSKFTNSVSSTGDIRNSTIIIGDSNTIVTADGVYVRHYQDRGILFINVPVLPSTVFGRDRLLSELATRVTDEDSVELALYGAAGVGKTTMAIALARHRHILDSCPDGVIWASLGLAPDIAGVQARWAKDLGLDVSDISNLEERSQRMNTAIGARKGPP